MKPCPICGCNPSRFFSGGIRKIEVIACVKGCKPNWNSVVVHLTSDDIAELGWNDLADAWDTIELYVDENGVKKVRFDAYPQGLEPLELIAVGPYLKWPPALI